VNFLKLLFNIVEAWKENSFSPKLQRQIAEFPTSWREFGFRKYKINFKSCGIRNKESGFVFPLNLEFKNHLSKNKLALIFGLCRGARDTFLGVLNCCITFYWNILWWLSLHQSIGYCVRWHIFIHKYLRSNRAANIYILPKSHAIQS